VRGRIIVVDDEKLERLALVHQLELDGHEVKGFEGAIPALELLRYEEWDVVLTDLRMPTMDGLAFLREIREVRSDTTVLIMTGYGSVQTAVQAMKAGAADYLTKPVDYDELAVRLAKALEQRALKRELATLRGSPAGGGDRYHALLGRSPAMRRVFERIQVVAHHPATVLIEGETGTGKDLVARTIHHVGPRSGGPFVKTSCAQLSREVLESELFGHEAGAFTGALKQRRGRFELADRGTFFLDDVDDIALDLQVKLLRVLEERRFERVGGERTLEVDVRFVCASKRDLRELVREGRFREDLYYRINVVSIELPPLRQRREDILFLANHFLATQAARMSRPCPELSPDACRVLLDYLWPGNVRELEHAMEHALTLSTGPVLTVEELPPNLVASHENWGCQHCLASLEGIRLNVFLARVEREAIQWALQRAEGSQSKAAQLLGIPRTTLRDRLAALFAEEAEPSPD
jgi:DNA-binding NtrC family response regulator